MSTTPAAGLAIPATAAALDAAPTRDAARQILTDWRSENWDAWASQEAHACRDDAAAALAEGHLHLLEQDNTWRVDYLPRDLARAWARVLSRIPADDAPAVYYRART